MGADDARLNITSDMARCLVAEQFSSLAHLPITPVMSQGWDNATFRLGEDLSVRIPTAKCYAAQPLKEQDWLPFLAPHLTVEIPHQVALGMPSPWVPWHWAIYTWREGTPLMETVLSQDARKMLALEIARFLKELHGIDATKGPSAGLHNFWRGGSLLHYDTDVKEALKVLTLPYSRKMIFLIWEEALSSSWQHPPRWVHGDMSVGNMLMRQDRLLAVIDFGCMGVGDPACDLVMAWTYFEGEERLLFQNALSFDVDTWKRAKGWALWKALLSIRSQQEGQNLPGMNPQKTLHRILSEHAPS